MDAVCVCCSAHFRARRIDQRYCFRSHCRKQRKAIYQKRKLIQDPTYRQNQADAQRHWRDGYKDYWRQYREDHPWYTRRNRRLQSKRNKRITGKRPLTQNVPLKIAKMDAQPIDFQGTYILTAVCGEGEDFIAKMDGSFVRITMISST